MEPTKQFYYILGAIFTLWLLHKVWRRLQLSRAKHPSLAGHSRWAKRFAKLVPYYEYSEEQFFAADDATEEIVKRRREGFLRLAGVYNQRFSRSAALTKEIAEGISDLQFNPAAIACPFNSAAMCVIA